MLACCLSAAVVSSFTTAHMGIDSRFGAEAEAEMDLLQAITIPFDDPKHLYFSDGDPELFAGPAYGVRAGSNVRAPFALIHKSEPGGEGDVFQADFLFTAHFKPEDEQVRRWKCTIL